MTASNLLNKEIKEGIEEYFFGSDDNFYEEVVSSSSNYVYRPDEYESYYLGEDGFYYSYEDENECFPTSASIATIKSGFLDQEWGTHISANGVCHGLRYVRSFMEADKIQKQYESAISRTSTYKGNLFRHVCLRFGLVYEPIPENYLCGYEAYGNFIVSHFAPKNIFSGMRMMKQVAKDYSFPVIIATLPYQAKQLIKAGFKEIGKVPQWFNGEIHIKTVCVNEAVDTWDLSKILDSLKDMSFEDKRDC